MLIWIRLIRLRFSKLKRRLCCRIHFLWLRLRMIFLFVHLLLEVGKMNIARRKCKARMIWQNIRKCFWQWNENKKNLSFLFLQQIFLFRSKVMGIHWLWGVRRNRFWNLLLRLFFLIHENKLLHLLKAIKKDLLPI